MSVVNIGSADDFKRKPQEEQRVNQVSATGLGKKISARSAFVLDSRTGRTIYEQMPDLPGQPASTIKVLTGLIAMEGLRDNDRVYASRYAANMPRSKVYLKRGASYRVNDLVNAVLMASANDASVALAEKIAGSEKAFAKLMTKKAEALGARHTVCKSANGLTRRGQQTTARDLAVIFNQAMENAEFAERMKLTKTKASAGWHLRTHNKALWNVDGALGGKTGYTRAARQTYVGKFKRGSRELVVSIMGSETMWSDIKALVEYGFSQPGKGEAVTVAENEVTGDDSIPSLSRKSKIPQMAELIVLAEQKKKTKI
ncbi:MAG: hypothetical protein OEY01_00565 [Desulfobulbaceae bacterium]|nr:hypothetical protein [Desulfobulbaceae bacterium]HIJ77783.1 D-alanyl-D-alanine carboxypeptidase [Deltaproteobacteria bacterium]